MTKELIFQINEANFYLHIYQLFSNLGRATKVKLWCHSYYDSGRSSVEGRGHLVLPCSSFSF